MKLNTDDVNSGRRIDPLALWILFSTWCSLSGWILSGLGYLQRTGYGISILILICGCVVFRRQLGLTGAGVRKTADHLFRRLSRRSYRWWLPRLWLLLTVLSFIGGTIYHPDNFDYLTYRFPRLLYWAWNHKWIWIDTINQRMNYSGTGVEWIMAPLFIFFKTDRLFFLINFLSYLFLPGLVFSVFRRLGVSGRLSWWWMWVLPSGYCYILQAASTGNDSIGAVWLLASLHYAFRITDSNSRKDFFLSCLAIALFTGIKTSNAPLALTWIILLFFRRRQVWKRSYLAPFSAALVIAAGVSILPVALLNIRYSGDYTGDPLNEGRMKVPNPISGILGNSLQMAVGNMSPPLWPKSLNLAKRIPASLQPRLERDFPRLALIVGEMQTEEAAGAGIGVLVCAAVLLCLGLLQGRSRPRLQEARHKESLWIVAGAAVALLVFMAKIGSEATTRLLAAYYPMLIAGIFVLASLDGRVVRHRLAGLAGVLAILSALPLLFFSPARPLFPIETTEELFARSSPAMSARLDRVYRTYALRWDSLRDLRELIPEKENTIGLVQSGDVPEASLWRPFGKRHIVDLTPAKSAAALDGEHVCLVVVDGEVISTDHVTIEDLARRWSASVIAEKQILLKAQRGPQPWYVLRRGCSVG